VKALIISDIHLGSESSKVKELIPRLEAKLQMGQVDILFLLGDIFQDINFRRLKKHHWSFLSLLRKYSDKIEIVWIIGNHDIDLENVMAHMVGLKTYEKYDFLQGDKKILLLHGHQFDSFITRHKITSKIFTELYLLLQKIPMLKSGIIKLINHFEINYAGSRDEVKDGAIEYAKKHNYDIVICGHTHKPEIYVKDEDVVYVNTGSWVSNIGTFITLENGIPEIINFKIKE
jgi:UDP-2,3-diacylglucosamine pyrophosphatase LpxH